MSNRKLIILFAFLNGIPPALSSLLGQVLIVPLLEVAQPWINAVTEQTGIIVDTFNAYLNLSSPWTYVSGALLIVLLYYGFVLFFVPLNRVRLLGEVGYISEGRISTKEMVNIIQKSRKVGDVPPVYPNGWFAVMESRNLQRGEAKSINCLGKNLAVFRGEDGRSHAIDAYCPHMGANLAAGGIVSGNCLECPFHGWQFRGDDGKCIHIPYCEDKHIPDLARVNGYITIERNGFIFLWHHAEGVDPSWELPEIEEITNGKWKYHGRTEHYINAHIEDIPENASDVAHLFQVHGPIIASGTDLRYIAKKFWRFARHDWTAQWSQETDPSLKHVAVLDLFHEVKIGNRHLPLLDKKASVQQIGPGITHMIFEGVFGRGMYILVLTPVEPLIQKMVHHIYYQKYTPRVIAKFFLLAESIMVERDMMIWNNKSYLSKALFVKSKEDALVAHHRRWYSQFYSENSPRIKFQKDTADW